MCVTIDKTIIMNDTPKKKGTNSQTIRGLWLVSYFVGVKRNVVSLARCLVTSERPAGLYSVALISRQIATASPCGSDCEPVEVGPRERSCDVAEALAMTMYLNMKLTI